MLVPVTPHSDYNKKPPFKFVRPRSQCCPRHFVKKSVKPVTMTASPSTNKFSNVNAWDLDGKPESGPSHQPWRAYWPPRQSRGTMSAEELAEQPWLTWKRDSSKINDKPWYKWVNDFGAMNLQKCADDCPYCDGKGCVSFSSKKTTLNPSFMHLVSFLKH